MRREGGDHVPHRRRRSYQEHSHIMRIRGFVLSVVIATVALPLAAQQPVPQQPQQPSVDARLEHLEQELAELRKQQQAEQPKADDPSTLHAFWKDGLRLETNDKNVQLQ